MISKTNPMILIIQHMKTAKFMFWITAIVSGVLATFALLYIIVLLLASKQTGELDLSVLGICLALFILGLGNINELISDRTAMQRYNKHSNTIRRNNKKLRKISKQLEAISGRQKDLLALVQGSSQHSGTVAPSPESPINGPDSSDETRPSRVPLNPHNARVNTTYPLQLRPL